MYNGSEMSSDCTVFVETFYGMIIDQDSGAGWSRDDQ